MNRLEVVEPLLELTDLVGRATDLRGIVTNLNDGLCAGAGFDLVSVSFHNSSLAALLGAPASDDDERRALRKWRNESEPEPENSGIDLLLPIRMQQRLVGVLRIRPRDIDDGSRSPMDLRLARAIAFGIGEVAFKVRLLRIAARSGQELAIAAERERIFRDLHESAGQAFYGIGLYLDEMVAGPKSREDADKLSKVRAAAAEGLANVRRTLNVLSILDLRARGLEQSIRELCRQFEEATGDVAEFKTVGELRLTHEIENALYRVIHEALMNVERYSRASAVVIILTSDDSRIRLSIKDDGVGLEQRQVRQWRSAARLGVRSMARAIKEVGGSFRLAEAWPRGLAIYAQIPLQPNAESSKHYLNIGGSKGTSH